jgi:hypothetical protein
MSDSRDRHNDFTPMRDRALSNTLTRRDFLQSLALMLGAAGAGALLAGCGGGSGQTEQTQQSTRQARQSVTSDGPCSDVSGLTDTELTMRNQTLQYVAKSPDPEKWCDNCKFWMPPPSGENCGTCQLIKGPINPKGYCTSWFAREA